MPTLTILVVLAVINLLWRFHRGPYITHIVAMRGSKRICVLLQTITLHMVCPILMQNGRIFHFRITRISIQDYMMVICVMGKTLHSPTKPDHLAWNLYIFIK